MSFLKILVALDPAEGTGEFVFRRALELARNNGSELMLFHCLEQKTTADLEGRVGILGEIDQSVSFEKLEHFRRQEVDHVKAWLEGFGEEAEGQGVSVQSIVDMGKPGKQICDAAERWRADLIVIGREYRGTIADILLGSVSNYVVHHAKCSVLLIHVGGMISPTGRESKNA